MKARNLASSERCLHSAVRVAPYVREELPEDHRQEVAFEGPDLISAQLPLRLQSRTPALAGL